MKGKYFNDKYSSLDEFRATAEKVISIKILNRSKNKMTLDELWRKKHCSNYSERGDE